MGRTQRPARIYPVTRAFLWGLALASPLPSLLTRPSREAQREEGTQSRPLALLEDELQSRRVHHRCFQINS